MARPHKYNPNFVRQLIEEGLDATDAVRIAATEMQGADESRRGINATQTACDALRYPEDLPDSTGADEGREATEQAIRDWCEANPVERDRWCSMCQLTCERR